ncbi:XrtN system VIT domain-containing protein [Pontibacter qinzhouensis]|uniref:XrtN system VIT domain-containing protein n=1 Tax=Pontibacter qinzhouensis TaxID=2603253 RepID=A0A5C8KDH5_9BACT|nr:XrtN system VIT domain-containing protein [Pontibacter qinzhouensis]TXK52641.1 XrtN system VIT domain-containing protein [Pontibacter qinzhouensis]
MKLEIIQKKAHVAKWPADQLTGTGFVLLSLLLYLLPEWNMLPKNVELFGIFMFNYCLASGFLVILIVRGHCKFTSPGFKPEHLFQFLVLALISCFSLNREIPIFQDSVQWLDLYLITLGVAMVGYTFRENLPVTARHLLLFWLGAGSMLMLYYSLYLLPFYLIGVIGAFFIGIGLHVLVPLQVLVCLVLVALKAYREDGRYLYSFGGGALLPLLFLVHFLGQWQERNDLVSQLQHEYIIEDNTELPRWVSISQQLPPDYITERLIKSNLVYQVPSDHFSGWDLPSTNFDELKRHDPFVMIASLLFGKPALQADERVKILESLYDARHQAQQRLWSGLHLHTSQVLTQVRLYPQFRLSYTEKVLNIRNSHPGNWNQQEAIYTFHLPEGSVVTSLSLWVNGTEEKAALTTQSKADSAYTTIVGHEKRDPSVVHWQEGNTVSVRIFPCTPTEDRQFKIGITSPLQSENGKLVYENIYFSGPSAAGAPETALVYLQAPATALDLPAGFKEQKPLEHRYHGSYRHSWQLTLAAPAFSTAAFTWNGYRYHLAPQRVTTENFEPDRIYLDLNAAWTPAEATAVWEAVKHKKVYVHDGEMVRLTPQNLDPTLDRLLHRSYSLFPLHLIRKPEQALLISKSTGSSPNLKDLKGSRFSELLAENLSQGTFIRTFHLGQHLSPYLKTLKELQLLQLNTGTTEALQEQLRRKIFSITAPAGEVVTMGAAGVNIIKTAATTLAPAATGAAAPDHLLRLFSYNHLLQQIGANYFRKDYIEEQHLEEARMANIVSPVSSLVVLETQADYDRFGIEKSKDTLGNASIKSSGAVPEPEEWVLIVLFVLLVASLTLKPYLVR